MKNENYNPEGKKLTFQQHMKLMREMEEKETSVREQNGGERPGRCGECNGSGFSLQAKEGLIYRTCKKCGDVKTF